jgi:type I restriction enzyme M protein
MKNMTFSEEIKRIRQKYGLKVERTNDMAKKKTVEKALNIDNILFNCRDILRAARNSGSFFEKRDMMLTLVFLRFIGEKYEDGIEKLRQILIEQGLDPDDENIRTAFFEDATFTDGTYNLPVEARWSTIINTPAPGLNVALDTALHSIATGSKDLKGCFIEGTFTTRNLASNDIKKLVDEVNKISHKAFGEEKDLIGRVYEYFLKEFAVNATKEEGEFYTPHDVVQLIATLLEPYDGTLYDPCCGSGGMFIQSAALVKSKQGDINKINIYGQEKDAATYRLAKMNLALRGLSHNLGETNDSSFTHDLHKGLHFNYIMANPPFNLKGWYNDNLKNDARWADYLTPPASNANYAWILHILSHLKKADGVAGFLLANGALNDSDTLEIRKKLIQNDKLEAIIVLPRELFITTDISVTLWILNQNKKGGSYHERSLRNREYEILFMDLRQWKENPVKGENKKKVRLVSEQIERAADIYHTWQGKDIDGTNYEMPELYRSVGISEIEDKGWTLTPSKYIEFIDHDLEIDYEKEMARIQAEMKEVMIQEKKSQQMLEDAFRGIGYGID